MVSPDSRDNGGRRLIPGGISMTAAQADFVSGYSRYFKVVPASTPELVREAQRIRFQVYCEELGFEDRRRFPRGFEHDDSDRHARHCLLRHRPSGRFAGCVRLVMADPANPAAPFPFEQVAGTSLRREILDPGRMDRLAFGEISRLAVKREFRRRRGEGRSADGVSGLPDPDRMPAEERRHLPHIAVELYLAAASIGLQEGCTSVFAMMEPRLARHMRFYGLEFEQVSDTVIHRGARAVYHITRDRLFERLSPPLFALLQRIRDHVGKDWPAE